VKAEKVSIFSLTFNLAAFLSIIRALPRPAGARAFQGSAIAPALQAKPLQSLMQVLCLFHASVKQMKQAKHNF